MAHRTGKGLVLITLVIAIAALILAWLAFNRTGENLNQVVEQEVQEALLEIENADDIDLEVETDEEDTTTDDISTTTTE